MKPTCLRCLVCQTEYQTHEIDYICPKHGDDGIVDVVYDYQAASRELDRDQLSQSGNSTMWRYAPLLPISWDALSSFPYRPYRPHVGYRGWVADSPIPPLAVGATPLYRSSALAEWAGVGSLWIKDEGVQPTGSLKDRASAMALVKAAERGATKVATASTGNAAAALAGLAASVGTDTVIFVPSSAPEAKVAQLLAFGATVLLVEGTYDDAFELCLRAAEKYGWYNRNTGYNPYMSEGKKTVSFEIAEQLGWRSPDVVVVSVGDGCIIGGVHKGFSDLVELGWIDRMPRLVGAQSLGSNFLTQAWENDEDVLTKEPIAAETVADSISAGLPRDRIKAMRAVKETKGAYVAVPDQDILAAIPVIAAHTGVFSEPAASASLAGLAAARSAGLISEEEEVVIISTGTGLKDVPAVRTGVEAAGVVPHRFPPDLAAVEETITRLEQLTP